ncbi:hypothetical protein LTR67_007299 [Exophiala xenobiotica]
MIGRVVSHDLPEGVVVGKEQISRYNILIVLIMAVGALGVSMPSGIISTTLGQPAFLLYFNLLTATGIKADLVAAMNAVFYTGGVFGLITSSLLIDRLGRKNSLRIGATVTVIAQALLAGSVNVGMFIVFRFFSGFGSSLMLGSVPLLISEVSPPHSRGFLVGFFGIAISTGYSLASWLAVAFYFCHNTAVQWRLPLAVTGVPALFLLMFLPWVPESPRWLMIRGQTEEAARIIRKLHGSDQDPRLEEFANLEINQMREQIIFEQQNHVSWVEFLTSRKYARRAWVAAFTFMTSQSAGILAIVTYSATISGSIGYGPVAQLCFSAGYLSVGIVAATCGALMIDRVGRVKLLVIGTIGQMVVLSIFTALVATYVGKDNVSANRAAIALIFIYFFVYGSCMESTVYTYVSELFPSHVRAKGVSWGIMFLYLTDIPFVTGSIYAFGTIGWRFYLVFIVTPAAMLIVLILLAKETKGKSLEEIGAIFGDHLVVRTLDEQIEDEKMGKVAEAGAQTYGHEETRATEVEEA